MTLLLDNLGNYTYWVYKGNKDHSDYITIVLHIYTDDLGINVIWKLR